MDDPNESVPVSWHPFSMWFTLLLNPIIHEGFYCNRQNDPVTSLTAGGLAARSINILFQVCLPTPGGSVLEPVEPTPTKRAHSLRSTQARQSPPRGPVRPSRLWYRRFCHEPS
jgi:hypothetical protein